MPTDFGRYFTFEELTDFVQTLASRNPEWVNLRSYGQSREGRPLHLLTIGATEGSAQRSENGSNQRSALWIDGGTHCAEWASVMSAIYTADRWVSRLVEGDEVLRAFFSRHRAYIAPCLSPDGYAAMHAGAPYLRSTLRPPPAGEVFSGLRPQDIDGDGRVRTMRFRHAGGPFVYDPTAPLGHRPRSLDDAASDACFVLDEGLFERWDGVALTQAPREFGLDLNRNFPASWTPFRMFGMDGGDYALSEPESRAVVDCIASLPRLCAAVTNHTYTGALLTQPYRRPSPLGEGDINLMERLATEAVKGTGWKALRVVPDFTYDAERPIVGVLADTFATVFGIAAYTLEIWDPFAAAGLELPRPAEFFARPDAELVRRLLAYFEQDPKNVAPFQPFDHPQLGPVELGGLEYMRTVRNPPLVNLVDELEKAFVVADRMRRALPEVEVVVHVERVGASLCRVRLRARNDGFLPTTSLAHGRTLTPCPTSFVRLQTGGTLRVLEASTEATLPVLDGWGSLQAGPSRHPLYPELSSEGGPSCEVDFLVSGHGPLEVHWQLARAGFGRVDLEV